MWGCNQARGEAVTAQPATPVANRTLAVVLVVSLLFIAVVLFVLSLVNGAKDLMDQESSGLWPYLLIGLFVIGDAIIPICPSESVLNTASVLSAQYGNLQLGWIMVAGALGAIIGDSLLYWIARLDLIHVRPRVEKLEQNEKVARGLEIIGSRAAMLLLLGRYLPGLRFVINATCGFTGVPYLYYLRWSAIGGTIWSIYTCAMSYWISTVLVGFPAASIVVSGVVTGAMVAIVYWLEFRHRRKQLAAEAVGTSDVTETLSNSGQ